MAMSREEYIKKMGGDNVSFHLMDKATVERRMREGELYAHKKTLDKQKDMRWNTKALNSKVLAGIINGDPVDKIAKSLIDVIGNDKAATMRNARTMLTQAECGGRQDSYENLAAQGVVQKKVWIATPDDRTRESHLEIDGEEVGINQEFSNGCMFPGDPDCDDPGEVWNCRCSMRTHIVGFRRSDGSISKVNYGRDETTHDAQIQAEKEERQGGQNGKGKS